MTLDPEAESKGTPCCGHGVKSTIVVVAVGGPVQLQNFRCCITMIEMFYFAVSIRKDCILSNICSNKQQLHWNSETVSKPYM
jgi:hypothetical protein